MAGGGAGGGEAVCRKHAETLVAKLNSVLVPDQAGLVRWMEATEGMVTEAKGTEIMMGNDVKMAEATSTEGNDVKMAEATPPDATAADTKAADATTLYDDMADAKANADTFAAMPPPSLPPSLPPHFHATRRKKYPPSNTRLPIY